MGVEQHGGTQHWGARRDDPERHSHLRLELDQTGLLAGVVGLLAGGLIRRYMGMEEQGIKKRAEERA